MNSGILKICGILIKFVLGDRSVYKDFARNHIQIMSQIVFLIEKNELYYTEF